MSPRVVLVLAAMFLVPGWAILLLTGAWRGFSAFSRWAVAVACSVAFYPALFYGARLAHVPLHAPALTAILVAALGIVVAYVWWTGAANHLSFDRLEWVAVVIVALSLATRAWLAIEYPFPAWADSLHHTLITKLTMAQGMLPRSLDPYFPNGLAAYHLGFHAIAAAFGTLSGVPPHTAVLWTTQILNGLAGLGVYVVVDRFTGRRGAVLALAAIGLFWTEPAVYVNYGRSTQLSSNFLVLLAWLAIVDAMRARTGAAALATLLCAGVTFLHFRNVIVLACLVVPTVLWLLIRERSGSRRPLVLAAVGVSAFVVGMPAILPALNVLVWPRVVSVWRGIWDGSIGIPRAPYAYANMFTRANLSLYDEMWIAIAVAGAVVLWRRSRLGIAMIGWLALLAAFLAIEALHPALTDVVNPGYVLLVLYLPAGVLVGVAANVMLSERVGRSWWFAATVLAMAIIALPRTVRVAEPFRFFMTREDLPAMAWIRDHTSPNAVFAINTMWWIEPGIAHGTDAGYWIPYYTDRATTAGCLLPGRFSYYAKLSTDVVALGRGEDRVAALAAQGVTHIYIGARGNGIGYGLNADTLKHNPALRVVYEQQGVTIFAL